MKHLVPEFEVLRARFPAGFDSSLVLPCLRRIQEDRGYVADSDIDELIDYLGVPRIQVEEVLSFYTQFRRQPIGRWHIQACRNVSCSLLGAERIIEHLSRKLGIESGRDQRRWPVFAVDGRMRGVVRRRAGRHDQRNLPRVRQPGAARRGARYAALAWRIPNC